MNPEQPDDLDSEVLADPLGEDPPPGVGPDPDASEDPGTSLVPSGSTSLVPADPFRRYLSEVRKYPPLSREQEQELARRYRETGDRQALFRLVTANLLLVVRVAQSFRRAANNLLDLVQEGNLGLLAAIDRFDPELGVRLPTYASWWVRAYMIKFLLDNVRLVRVGTTNARRKLLRNLRKEKAKLESQGFEVGPKLLAEHFGVSVDDVTEVQKALDSRDVSLDEPVGDEPNRFRGEMLADSDSAGVEETVARGELQEQAEAAIARFRKDLSERELALLDRRILSDSPLTLQALGEEFGTTREAVRQAEGRLMKRLTEFLKAEFGDLGRVRIGPS
jgi:RNA polymerase sigma-32 factor